MLAAVLFGNSLRQMSWGSSSSPAVTAVAARDLVIPADKREEIVLCCLSVFTGATAGQGPFPD
jgi:hypothetical protein